MEKVIYKADNIRDKIREAVDLIAEPVRQTLSPKGRNALFESDLGEFVITNDGISIAKTISVEDRLQQSIIDIIKGASLKTNNEAGDGTTTTVILSSLLTKEALKLLDEGMDWIEIRNMYEKIGGTILAKLKRLKVDIKKDEDLRNIAMISSNNDDVIAKDVLSIVKTAGEDGMVFLDGSNKSETEIIKDLGFMLKSGILYQELFIDVAKPIINLKNVPTLITDKRIYYAEEAEAILRVAIEAGWSSVAIIARDFIGEAVPTFIANHKKNIQVILIKDPKSTESSSVSLDDLSLYLGGKIVTDKTGNLVTNVNKDSFVLVASVYQDLTKTLLTPKVSASKVLKERINYLKVELKKDKDDKDFKERLSSLTNGVVTVKVGGRTAIEVREKLYRYEDAVNATRNSMKYGYLVGGGVSLLKVFSPKDYNDITRPIAKKFCESVVRQIAQNCNRHEDTVVNNVIGNNSLSYGYNALKDEYGDLLKAGVIDSYSSVQMAVENAVASSISIASIGYFIINDKKKDEKETNSRRT